MVLEGPIPAEWCRTIGSTCPLRNHRKGRNQHKGVKLCQIQWVTIQIPSVATQLRLAKLLKSTRHYKWSPIWGISMLVRSLKALRLAIRLNRIKALAIASLRGLPHRKCSDVPARTPRIRAIHEVARRLLKPRACNRKWYSSIIAIPARRHATHNHQYLLGIAVQLGQARATPSTSRITLSIIQRNSRVSAPKPKRPFHSNSIRLEPQLQTTRVILKWKTLNRIWTSRHRLTGVRPLDSRASAFANSHAKAA